MIMHTKGARILLDVGIAALLAGAVGLERELDKKPAGLRTNMVIGAIAALFILLGKLSSLFTTQAYQKM